MSLASHQGHCPCLGQGCANIPFKGQAFSTTQVIWQKIEISVKPINYTGSNTDVCTLSRLLLEGARVLALQSLNSPHRRKHHLEQEMIQGQATKEKRVGGKEAGGDLLKEEMSVMFLPAAFSFYWNAGLSLFLFKLRGAWGEWVCVCVGSSICCICPTEGGSQPMKLSSSQNHMGGSGEDVRKVCGGSTWTGGWAVVYLL